MDATKLVTARIQLPKNKLLMSIGGIRKYKMSRNSSSHEFIEIPEGFSCIGSDELDPYAGEKERPLREVFISTFWISKYPTTVSQFVCFLNETRHTFKSNAETIIGRKNGTLAPSNGYEDFPITNVSWELACEYCRWLSSKLDRNVVLPSEAEWEKAARGDDSRIWPWGNSFDPAYCNSSESGNSALCSVFSYEKGASPYGIMHLSGNVWEWCQDYWHPFSHNDALLINPINLIPSKRRVVKGGSAFCTKEIIRPACRDWTNSVNQGGGDDGFRVAIRTF